MEQRQSAKKRKLNEIQNLKKEEREEDEKLLSIDINEVKSTTKQKEEEK